MTKKQIFLLVLISISVSFFAQSEGYMGKHFVVNYGIHLSPAIIGASKNNTTLLGSLENAGSAETGVITLNNLHELSLDYIKSNKWVIEFNAKYYKTAYDNSNPVNAYTSNFNPNGNKPANYYSIRGLSYALIFKRYKSKYVAPWGRYIMFGPVVNTVKTSYDEQMYVKGYSNSGSNYSNNVALYDFGDKEQNFVGFNFIYGWGRSRVIKDKIVIDYGASLQVFSLLTLPADMIGLTPLDKPTNLSYMEDTYKIRVRGINRFNVFFKVGYLF